MQTGCPHFRLLGNCLLLGSDLKNCKSNPKFLATLFRGKSHAFNVAKSGLGYILGEFFTNISGHPVCKAAVSYLNILSVEKGTIYLLLPNCN
jgi:hypothetical protein